MATQPTLAVDSDCYPSGLSTWETSETVKKKCTVRLIREKKLTRKVIKRGRFSDITWM